MARKDEHRDGGFGAITRAAWSEFKVATDYSTGLSEVRRGTRRPPKWFLSDELGFGFGTGVSIMWTLIKVAPRCQEQLLRERQQRLRRESRQAGERAQAEVTLATRHRKNRLSGADYQRLMRDAVRTAGRTQRARSEEAVAA